MTSSNGSTPRSPAPVVIALVAIAGVGLLGNFAFNFETAHQAGIQLYALVNSLMSVGVVAGCLGAWVVYGMVSDAAGLRAKAIAALVPSALPLLLALVGLCVLAPEVAHYLRAPSSLSIGAALAYCLATIVSAGPIGSLLSQRRFGVLAATTGLTQVLRVALALLVGLKHHPDEVALLTSAAAILVMAGVNGLVARRATLTKRLGATEPARSARTPRFVFDGRSTILVACLFLLGPLPVAFARHDFATSVASRLATGQVAVNAMVLFLIVSWVAAAWLVSRQFVSLLILALASICGLVAFAALAPAGASWLLGSGFAPSRALIIELTLSAAACGVAMASVLMTIERPFGSSGWIFLVTAGASEFLINSFAHGGLALLALSPALAFACGGAALMLVAQVTKRRERGVPALHLAPLGAGSGEVPSNAVSLLDYLTIGVMAHNEALTIRACLEGLLAESDRGHRLARIVVVVSGSTDGTVDVVRDVVRLHDNVHLIVEPHRTGKANAINLFLEHCSTPLAGLVSADVGLTPGSLTALTEVFRDEAVGMAGGRIEPQNERRGICNALVHLQWELHDLASMRTPKLGEVVVFRRVFSRIEGTSLTDEVSVEALLTTIGYGLVYVREATVLNHGPTRFTDYMRHRSRIHAGHLLVQRSDGYMPSTMRASVALRAALDLVTTKLSKAPLLMLALLVEVCVRIIAKLEVHRRLLTGDRTGVWVPIESAKRDIPLPQPSPVLVLPAATEPVEAHV
jgi:hypothetical protein